MNKYIVFLLAFASAPGVVSAVEFGLGVTLESESSGGGNMLLVPIALSSTFLIEPFYYENSAKVTSFLGVSGDDIGFDISETGVGLFYRSPIKESVNFYLGARGGYRIQEYKYDSAVRETRENLYGYSVTPILGLQYQILPTLWLGGEAGWSYRKIEGKNSDSLSGDSKRSSESDRTETRVVLRYLF